MEATIPHQIGLAFLGLLGVFFGSYGFAKLAQAYHAASLAEWTDKALPGAGGVIMVYCSPSWLYGRWYRQSLEDSIT